MRDLTVYRRSARSATRAARAEWRALVLAAAIGLCAGRVAHAAGLTEGGRLAAVYDAILSARFDRAGELLAATCPPAPAAACADLGVVSIWWQIVLDPDSRALDARLESAASQAISEATAWTGREPRRAEAWFYLAGAYAPLVQWRVLRGQRLAAARDGNRIRSALERALALDPSLHDAKFGIGLYHYYADVAPAAARMLRWLLLLPGGDKVQGLREMLEARNRGELLRGEADFQLHWLYLWYEQQPQRALDLLGGLDARYPSNPVFLQRIAEVQDEYRHDHPASAMIWQRLLDRARGGLVSAPGLAETRAHLGLAVELDAMYETDRAIDHLEAVLRAAPAAPFGSAARAQMLLGEAYDRLGRHDRAAAAYRAALAAVPSGDTSDVRDRARTGLRRRPDPAAAAAYRVSLDGLRALERGEAARAAALLGEAHGRLPGDWVVAYRYARSLLSTGDEARARDLFERVVQSREEVPAIALASACVDYAALLERSGDRSRALALYRRAIDVVGGAQPAREEARAAIKKLGQ